MEEVLAWQPEVILDSDPNMPPAYWDRYANIPAVKARRVFAFDPDLFRPGPRIAETSEQIAHLLYPALFASLQEPAP